MSGVKAKASGEVQALRIILCAYIFLCVIIAGLNYGYAPKAPPEADAFIRWLWAFYENWIKTAIIIACSILTVRIVSSSRRTAMRKRNLIGLTLSALVVHVAAPLFSGNDELYFFAMPLPWTSKPLQLLSAETAFYRGHFPAWGAAGISAALVFYACVCATVLVGTLLLGRRWQCSTICLFNGFAAEIFEPAIPLLGKASKPGPRAAAAFAIARWLCLAVSAFFSIWWILFLAGKPLPGDQALVSSIETYKYLGLELLTAMFFWIAYLGRGYCLFCSLGTVLSWIGALAGQRIDTRRSNCIGCGACDRSCPVGIEIKSAASRGAPVRDLRCVGCAHCVDACPTRTLSYSTRFLRMLEKARGVTRPAASAGSSRRDSRAPLGGR